MRRGLIVLICLLIALLSYVPSVHADDVKEDIKSNVDTTMDSIDFSEFDDFLKEHFDDDRLRDGIKSYINSIIKGDINLDFLDIMKMTIGYLLRDIKGFLPLVITIVAISLLFSIVDSLSSRFTSKGTSEIIYFACFVTMILVVLSSLYSLTKETIATINIMHEFMSIIFPILLSLMASLGGMVTASVFKPLMAVLIFFVSNIISKVVMPIFIATVIFSIVGNLSNNIRLDKMNESLKSVGESVLGIIFGLFTTFLTVQGITGASIDSVSIKSAKFAISSYVPILGGYLSDGFDLVLASSVLIKNALGFVGIIVILLLTLSPVIKITIFTLVLKMTAGIIEPICDSRFSKFIYSIAKNMTLLITIILGIAFMFFIMCMLVILSLNVVV